MSTPNLNTLSMFGVAVVLVYCILLGIDGDMVTQENLAGLCYLRVWFIVCGMTLSFGPLFAKTHRIHQIFGNAKLRLIKINDTQLFAYVFVMLTLDIIFLIIWLGVHPFRVRWHYLPLVHNSDGSITRPYVEECRSDSFQYWIIALCVYKGFELILGAYTAAQIRNVQVKAVNDSHYTGLSLYNVTLISLFVVPLSFALGDKPDAQYAFTSIGVWAMATGVALLMFVPKLRAIKNGEEGLWTGTAGGGSRKSATGESRKSKNVNLGSEMKNASDLKSEFAEAGADDQHVQIKALLKKIPDVDLQAIIEQLQAFIPKDEPVKRSKGSRGSTGDAQQSKASAASVNDTPVVVTDSRV